MSTSPDQERLEFEELCRKNPNHTLSFWYYTLYRSHIKKWKPLIESNDPSIYSDWERVALTGRRVGPPANVYVMDLFLTENQLFQEGIKQLFKIDVLSTNRQTLIDQIGQSVYDDIEVRRELIKLMFESYVYYVEETGGGHTSKIKKINLIDDVAIMNEGGRFEFKTQVPLDINPFDLFYYVNYTSGRIPIKWSAMDYVRLVLFACVVLFLIWYYASGQHEADIEREVRMMID